jgi:hypothetical protein
MSIIVDEEVVRFDMRRSAINTAWFILCLAILAMPAAAAAAAQKPEHVGEFDIVVGGGGYSEDATGDLQFVPGGYVIKKEGNRTERYVFRGTRFEPLKKKLPGTLEKWNGPDWDGDFYDEIDLHNSKVRRYLPKGAKLKKVLDILQGESKPALSVACYTLRSFESQIFIIGLLDLSRDRLQPGPAYQKLWTVKVREGYSYGDLQHQAVPGVGDFVLLYSTTPGADSVEYALDVYRLHWDNQPQGPARKVPR